MSTVLGNLAVKVSADLSGLHSGLSTATRVMDDTGRKLQGINVHVGKLESGSKAAGETVKGLHGHLGKLGEVSGKAGEGIKGIAEHLGVIALVTGAAEGAIAAFGVEAVRHAEEAGHAAYEMSEKFGLVPTQASAWVTAAGQVGVGADQMSTAFKFLSKNMESVNLKDAATQGKALATANKGVEAAGKQLDAAQLHLTDTEAKLAGKHHLTTAESNTLRDAHAKVAAASEKLNKAHEATSVAMAGMTPASAGAAQAFQALGVPINDSEGKLRNLNDVMLDAADKFKAMPDGPEKAGLAMKLFGKSGADLIPVLNEGRDGLQKLMKAGQDSGAVMSNEQVAAAQKSYLAHKRMDMAIGGLASVLGNALIPAMTAGADLVTDKVVPGIVRLGPVLDQVGTAIQRASDATRGVFGWFERFRGIVLSVAAVIGTVLLPTLLNFVVLMGVRAVQAVIQFVVAIVRGTIALIAQNVQMVLNNIQLARYVLGQIAARIAVIAGAIATGIATAAQWLWNVAMMANPIGLVILAIVLLVGGIILAYQHVGWFHDAVNRLGALFKQVGPALAAIWQGVSAAFGAGVSAVKGAFEAVVNAIKGAFDWVVSFLQSTWGHAMIAAVLGPLGLLIDFIMAHWARVKDITMGVWNAITGFLSVVWNGVVTLAQVIWGAITAYIRLELEIAQAIIAVVWGVISAALSFVWNQIVTAATFYWTLITGAIQWAVNTVRAFLDFTWKVIVSAATIAWNQLSGIATEVWDRVSGAITSAMQAAHDKLSGIWDSITGMARAAWGVLENDLKKGLKPIKDLLNGFIKGLNAAFGAFGLPELKQIDIPGLAGGGALTSSGVQMLAGGGSIGAGFMTNGPRAIVGEGRPSYPEFVIPTDPVYKGNATRLLMAAAQTIGLAGGGALGNVGAFGGQCVEYIQGALGLSFRGNADQWVNAPYAHTQTAAAGEVAVFTHPPYGHVAIVEGPSDASGSFPVIDSNWVAPVTIGRHVMNKAMYDFATFLNVGASGAPGGGGPLGPLDPIAGMHKIVDDAMKNVPGGWAQGLAKGLTEKVFSGIPNWIGSHMPHLPGTGPTPAGDAPLTGSHGDWLHAGEKLAGVGADWDKGLDIIIQHESGWSNTAQNNCVTLDAHILTRRGWLTHDEVQADDQTVGYNPATGGSEWTKILRVHHYERAEVYEVSNARWSAQTTLNHRWWDERRVREFDDPPSKCPHCDWPVPPPVRQVLAECPECAWKPQAPRGVALHRSLVHGIRERKVYRELRHDGKVTTKGLAIHLATKHGLRLPSRPAFQGRYITTNDINMHSRLRLAAPVFTGEALNITITEAAILGWVFGDGHVEKRRDVPRGRKTPSMSIGQAKPQFVSKIRELLSGTPHAEYSYEPKSGRQRSYMFRLDPHYATDLLARSRYDEIPHSLVLSLSPEQRTAWLEAVIDAEGSRDRQANFGARGGAGVLIHQCEGPKAEAIKLAAYLTGYRPSVLRSIHKDPRAVNWRPIQHIGLRKPHVDGATLRKQRLPDQPVWCVTTELGTWTCRQGDHIFLTGNSDINAQRGDPSRGLMQLTLSNQRAFGGISDDPVQQIGEGIRYILSRYGGIGNVPGVRSVLAGMPYQPYDVGGMLPTGLSLAMNGTGSAEHVFTGGQMQGFAGMTKRLASIEQLLEEKGSRVEQHFHGQAVDAAAARQMLSAAAWYAKVGRV